MLTTTFDVLLAGMKTDPTIDALARKTYAQMLRTPPDRLAQLLKTSTTTETSEPSAVPEPRLIRRAEAAKRLTCSLRTIDNLHRQGVLLKVRLPGRTRAAGLLESDVAALILAGENGGRNETGR